ncbi:MAG: hypothetical protein J3R72DRAFT_491080 [Linnemannia gamsii]|nr:MAG: hypothetical protein J3R72DRAFT_491080 [Linnemannia gamsii]
MCELLIPQYLEQVQILEEHESACKQAIYIRTFNPTTGSSVPTTSSSVPTGRYFITHGHRIARLEIFSVRFSTVKLYDKTLDLLVEIKTKYPRSNLVSQHKLALMDACLLKLRVLEDEHRSYLDDQYSIATEKTVNSEGVSCTRELIGLYRSMYHNLLDC